jgi:hypothetical protein
MSGTEIILWLALATLLGTYAYIEHRQTLRSLGRPCDPAEWTGKAIDVARLKPRIEGLRHDYLAVRQPPKGLCFHRSLIELARRAVARLAYFHDRAREEHPARTHSS